MRGLVRSELRRLASRRFVRVVGVLVLLGVLVGAAGQFVTSSRDLEGPRREAEAVARECRRSVQELDGSLRPGEVEARCDPGQYLADPRFRFAEEMPSITRGVALAFVVVAFVVGASSAGAEWGSGYVTPLLTWEPRRWRTLLGKVVGIGSALGVAAFLGLALLAVTQYPAAVFRGTTAGADGGLWWSLTGVWARGAAVSALWGIAGVSLATVTRNTAGAVGIGLVYGTIVDPLLGAWKEWLAPWLLQRNLFHALGLPVTASRTAESDFGGTQTMFVGVDAPSVALTLGRLSAYIAALVLVAYAAFRARDVS